MRDPQTSGNSPETPIELPQTEIAPSDAPCAMSLKQIADACGAAYIAAEIVGRTTLGERGRRLIQELHKRGLVVVERALLEREGT